MLISDLYNTCLILFKPREIKECLKWLNECTFLDRYIIEYYTMRDACDVANAFIHSHDYEYYILISDDVILDPLIFYILYYDAKKFDLQVVSGYGRLREGFNLLSITSKPVDLNKYVRLHGVLTKVSDERIGEFLSWADYNFVQIDVVKKILDNQFIIPTYFTGFYATLVKREVFDKVKLRCLAPQIGYGIQADLAFSVDCIKHNIDQFVDLRCYIEHIWFKAKAEYPIYVNVKPKNTYLIKRGEFFHGSQS